ncbi:ribosomal-protein-alanine acetyltransferase [Parascardovia denticolens DSM 10105 = JCM 12538]|uniref:Ribosomal-protein-alanine acetyltransferase n=1 Tax=Parascardovia denticolens DSM 10105 = JCM 12538 TaxID=864564 RepID=E6JZL4_PARDN|nr:ribosomal protein S18-alanine N-acetyltransferase [Parascardovia denticolens]EFG32593.1 ribosomal-protein-alanine acetyltransferase [Parascardovia denticolens F0305]EFT84060.1 ribosomal-protein-alanine acetyltransferase [Parascardovia denticolens DSM 10105 = JCM 12538]BAR05102.1 putative ribosomal-protein-alanine N-acetyltransferase [Parascardovia denticolens DSM 10105 = JCM 12538]
MSDSIQKASDSAQNESNGKAEALRRGGQAALPDSLVVRPLEESDLDAIAGLESDLFAEGAWSRDLVEEEVHSPTRTYLVVSDMADPSHPLAYGGFWFDGDDAELMTIGVDRAWQGRGIGKTLLRTLMDRARILKARRMLLEVRVDNDPALVLYRGLGFSILGIRKRYYQPGNVDAYTMSVDLGVRPGRKPAGFSLPVQPSADM